MAESTGIGQELGIIGKLKQAVGVKPKPTQTAPPPTPQATETNSALGQIVQGVKDPVTGETRMPDASWRGPGIGQNDNRLMGEARATSPGNEFLKANKADMPMPEIPAAQPTYIAQGTELDNQPLASSQAEPATAPEPTQIPKAEPAEEPAAA